MDPTLYRAAELGNWDEIKRFESQFDTQRTRNKDTVLHVLSRYSDSSFPVQQILQRIPKLLLKRNAQDETSLHIAARKGHSNVVRAVLDLVKINKECRSVLTSRNGYGDLALHEAIKNGCCDIVRLLVEEDLGLIRVTNRATATPLYLAAEKGDEALVALILSYLKSSGSISDEAYNFRERICDLLLRAFINRRRTIGGKTALHAAAIGNFPAVDKFGWTALHYAARCNHQEVARQLLLADRSTAYVLNNSGQMALHIAVIWGHMQVIEELLNHCPDCWNTVTSLQRENAIHLAVKTEQQEVLESILRKPWASELVSSVNLFGNTPLHLYAATEGLLGHDLVNHAAVQRNAINEAGLTPMDVLVDVGVEDKNRQEFLRSELEKVGERHSGQNVILNQKASFLHSQNEDQLNRTVEAYQIVSTLIITIAFAAVLTIPGGYESNDGARKGQPVFLKRGSFRVFIVTDTISMMFSLKALVFLLNCHWRRRPSRRKAEILRLCRRWISIALLAMAVSFLAGLYVAVPTSVIRGFLLIFACFFVIPLLLNFLEAYKILLVFGLSPSQFDVQNKLRAL